MDLELYVENLNRQLAVAAEAGGEEARALVERLIAPLEAAIPAPMAKSISVAVGESETIRSGFVAIRTFPFAAFTETGKGDC